MKNNLSVALVIFIALLAPFSLAASGSVSGEFDVAAGNGNIIISQPGMPAPCGNGIYEIRYSEQCDGSALPFTQCSEYLGSSYSGTLSCKAGCILDTSQCVPVSNPPGNGGNTGGTGGSSGGSGGGGGGGSPTTTTTSSATSSSSCVENWECTNWTNQGLCGTRVCSDKNKCGTTSLKPAETLDCEIIGVEKSWFSGITGAVTGVVGSPLGIGVLIFILAIVAVSIYAFIMRKRAGK